MALERRGCVIQTEPKHQPVRAGRIASDSENNALPSTSGAIGITCCSNVGITGAV
jgi:hypothetical protein